MDILKTPHSHDIQQLDSRLHTYTSMIRHFFIDRHFIDREIAIFTLSFCKKKARHIPVIMPSNGFAQ